MCKLVLSACSDIVWHPPSVLEFEISVLLQDLICFDLTQASKCILFLKTTGQIKLCQCLKNCFVKISDRLMMKTMFTFRENRK